MQNTHAECGSPLSSPHVIVDLEGTVGAEALTPGIGVSDPIPSRNPHRCSSDSLGAYANAHGNGVDGDILGIGVGDIPPGGEALVALDRGALDQVGKE